jgi:hypothetical protein
LQSTLSSFGQFYLQRSTSQGYLIASGTFQIGEYIIKEKKNQFENLHSPMFA